MEYNFVKAIEEVIDLCRDNGRGMVRQKDDNGNIILWLEADWVEYNNTHDVIELSICYTDTGRIAYSTYIMETLVEK